MADWPPVWALIQTYKRTAATVKTARSLVEHLKYPNLHYHICDDGSGEADDGSGRRHVEAVVEVFQGEAAITWHEMDRPEGDFAQACNCGGSINRGIRLAQENGALVHLMNFDDWALVEDLDIRPLADILYANENLGFVRLSYAVQGNAGIYWHYAAPRLNGRYTGVRLIRDWARLNPWWKDDYLVSTMPYIAHLRFFQAYGFHPERCSPGQAEHNLNKQYVDSPLSESGPHVINPVGWATEYVAYRNIANRGEAYRKGG